MSRKSLALIASIAALSAAAYGQQAAKPDVKPAEKVFAFSFGDEGGYLGVQTVDITNENRGKYDLSTARGVAIDKVMENSPAASAGLAAGDVILRFNGEEVTSVRKLMRLIGEVAPDHQARITIVRKGAEQEVTATLAKRPAPKFENGSFTLRSAPDLRDLLKLKDLPAVPNAADGDLPGVPGLPGRAFTWTAGTGRQIGVGITPLTKQLAEHFRVDGGVLINNVRENSPASKAGLRAGDIIVEVEGKAVKGDLDLIRAIQAKKEGDVSVTYVRDGKRQTVSVTPEASKDSGFVFETDGENGFIPAMPPAVRAYTRMAAPPAPARPLVVRPKRVI